MHKNPNCDGSYCTHLDSEIRVLPTGGDSNALLCRACFHREIMFRKSRNLELGAAYQFKLPDWNDLKIYDAGS